jgi:hypothetical protein
MKWYKKIKRAKGVPGLDQKIRQFKLDYIDAKQTLGGFLKEGEDLFLEEVRKDPTAWDLTKVREQVYSQLFRTIWHEDDDVEDGSGLPLFVVAGIEVQRTLSVPDAATVIRKVSSRWATAAQALAVADFKDLIAARTQEAANRIRQVAETARARGRGDLTTLLYNVRDGLAPPPRAQPSSSPTPLPPPP